MNSLVIVSGLLVTIFTAQGAFADIRGDYRVASTSVKDVCLDDYTKNKDLPSTIGEVIRISFADEVVSTDMKGTPGNVHGLALEVVNSGEGTMGAWFPFGRWVPGGGGTPATIVDVNGKLSADGNTYTATELDTQAGATANFTISVNPETRAAQIKTIFPSGTGPVCNLTKVQ
jgi:hypothetical protein